MNSFDSQSTQLRPLLDYLAQKSEPRSNDFSRSWQGWHINRITGGANNLLYRATGTRGDFAIKFTMRDERDRAGREYRSLRALDQAGLSVAPKPILLDQTSYAQPVVVQSWLEGEVIDAPPTTDEEWRHLLDHCLTIHSLTPDNTKIHFPSVVLTANSAEACRQIVRAQLTHLPAQAQPKELQSLVRRWESLSYPDWGDPPITLCRGDNNILNFVRRPHSWASVDWEYSGWGDPAFEIAELMTHVAYINVPHSRWQWVREQYDNHVDDPTFMTRIEAYYQTALVWWAVRLARFSYEVPRGIDQRLSERLEELLARAPANYAHYVELAEKML